VSLKRALISIVMLLLAACSAASQRSGNVSAPNTPLDDDSTTSSTKAEASNRNGKPALGKSGPASPRVDTTARPNGEFNPDAPVANDVRSEVVSLTQAAEWWPHGPLLRAEWVPREGSNEAVLIGGSASKRGRATDPTKEMANVDVYYQFPPLTVENSSHWKLVDKGKAIWISVTFYPPGATIPFSNEIWTTKRTTVRGHVARIFETRKSDGSNRDWRLIMWDVAATSGTVQWLVGSSPVNYSEPVTLDFIERLVEVP
jgi:hypothetical protein